MFNSDPFLSFLTTHSAIIQDSRYHTGLHLYKGTCLTCFILLAFFYYENTMILICVKQNINKIHHIFEKQKFLMNFT